MKRILLFAGLIVLTGGAHAEQVCRSGNFDAVRLEVAADSRTVIDRQARLQWQRCAYGLSGAKCEQGNLDRLNIRQAAGIVDQANRQAHAGQKGWRLPTTAELSRLLSRKCLDPAIDLEIFPNTPPVEFWASENNGAESGYVDFKDAYVAMDDENLPNAVRLVRDMGKEKERRKKRK